MKISTRLVLSALAVGAITAGLGAFAMNRLANVRQAARVVEQEAVPAGRTVAAMAALVDRVRMAELRHVLAGNSAQRRYYDAIGDTLLAKLASEQRFYQTFSDTPEEVGLYTHFIRAWDRYLSLHKSIDSLFEHSLSDSARTLIGNGSQLAFDEARVALDGLTGLTIQQAAVATERSVTRYALARTVIILLVVASLLIGLLGAWALIRGITSPLNTLVHAAERISAGDLTQRMTIRTQDEFEKLGQTFNEMAHALSTSHETLERRVAERTAELSREKEAHREARQLAELANAAKTDFLANMSHELRTPLNSVIGFAEILLKNKSNAFATKELGYLDRIRTNGRHLLTLINRVLDLSQVEAGQLSLDVTPIALNTLVFETIATLEPQAAANGVRLFVESTEEDCILHADREKVCQILINLVDNGIKFSEKGEVRLIVRTSALTGKPLAIDVADTGIGIPAGRLASIFEAFQQEENTRARKYGGTGLGLTISRSLARLMGFEIIAKSEVGLGSTFSLIFAAERAEDRPIA